MEYYIDIQNNADTDVHNTSLSRKKIKLHGVRIVLAASNRTSNSKWIKNDTFVFIILIRY